MDRHLQMLKKSKSLLLNKPNVIGVGVGFKQTGEEDTGQLALLVLVEKKVPVKGMRKEQIIPLKIGDLHTDVIEVGRVRFLGERTQRWRPAQPGVSIGHYRITAGTLGAVVKDKTTGEKLILSNNHILANATNGFDGRSAIGDPILQPGPHDGGISKDRIASLLRFGPVNRIVKEPECPVAAATVRASNALLHFMRPSYDLKITKRTQEYNLIDAAVARPDAQNIINEEILEIGYVQGVAEVKPGEIIQKSGRTSGMSEGKVQAIGITIKVEISENESGWFSEQVMSSALSRPGDSGSLILNQKKQAVGLLFAGSDKYTMFNRINNVMEKLKIKF